MDTLLVGLKSEAKHEKPTSLGDVETPPCRSTPCWSRPLAQFPGQRPRWSEPAGAERRPRNEANQSPSPPVGMNKAQFLARVFSVYLF